MNDLAIRVENVYKEYRLGAIGGATLKGEIQSKIAKLRHQEDPNRKIGAQVYEKNERFMALNGLSFDVKKGETLGIIGQNGAGKSTILKLICRVTAPTRGRICMNGRLTSMLEVGTGFHPELTGRENVYLNGAILGMSKAEISRKFDEIVAFSEVEQFIDTPVKRYSSGMKVKLAFSVASHLDSEIMIMDEVLAVGDVNFQNKCINRMKEVAETEGRTILYVSHNMPSVKKLCDRCIVLSAGQVAYDGATEEAISVYVKENFVQTTIFDLRKYVRDHKCNLQHVVTSMEILDSETNVFVYGEDIRFRINWNSKANAGRLLIKAVVSSNDTEAVGVTYGGELKYGSGSNSEEFIFNTECLVPGKYTTNFKLYNEDNNGNVVYYDQCKGIDFSIVHGSSSIHLRHWFADWGKVVLPPMQQIEQG